MVSNNITLKKLKEDLNIKNINEILTLYNQTKNSKIKEMIINRYLPFAKKYLSKDDIIEKEDLEKIAYELLIKCIDNYNPMQSVPFSQYLYYRINEYRNSNLDKVIGYKTILIRLKDDLNIKNINDAFIIYYQTKNPKVREMIIYSYMPLAKKQLLEYQINEDDKEDLEQTAYELLIKSVDKFNPMKSVPFSQYLHRKINTFYREYLYSKKEEISLTNLEVFANGDIESKTIDKIIKEEIINKIKKTLDTYPSQKAVERFKRIYGIDCEIISVEKLAKMENITVTVLYQMRIKVLLYLFLNLSNEFDYYPSEIIKILFKDMPCWWNSALSKDIKNMIKETDLNKRDYLSLYSEDNEINSVHKALEIKR